MNDDRVERFERCLLGWDSAWIVVASDFECQYSNYQEQSHLGLRLIFSLTERVTEEL